MNFIELQITCSQEFGEIIAAELSFFGFEAFQVTDTGLNAYIDEKAYEENVVAELAEKYLTSFPFSISKNLIPKQNWNEIWEKNFKSVIVEDTCLIRAGFHRVDKKYPYEIIITPKMSFGTGHHDTTYLMLKMLLNFKLTGQSVLDIGTGTGILAILAYQLGASNITAVDIDDWSIKNAAENFKTNNIRNFQLLNGKIEALDLPKFDLILANINKNVITNELKLYRKHLKKSGKLMLSGFYREDANGIVKSGINYGLVRLNCEFRNEWACLVLGIGE